jgi:endoglucanase
MKHVRLLGIANQAFAMLVLQALVACEPAYENLSQPRENDSVNDEAPADSPGGALNPQRNPELWRRPAAAPAFPGKLGIGSTKRSPRGSGPTYSDGAMPYRGVNLAGGEFGSALPGVEGSDYTFPTHAEVDYFIGKRLNTFRVGFKWERMQHSANGELDATYFSRLEDVVTYATSKGAYVILNPHNFARYYGKVVGSVEVPKEVFADFWRRVSSRFKANPKVLFNLVNEPHDMSTEQWVGAANAAIAAIRSAKASNTVIVPGNGWTGAHGWTSNHYGTPNSEAMLNIADSEGNILFEAHQYLDSDSSGTSPDCVSTTVGRERLEGFVKWLRDSKRKGFLGEFAGADNATCNTAIENMLDYIHASSDVLVGWLWWAGGPWWGDYMFTLDPDPRDGKDRPQMSLLAPYLQ